MTKLYGIKNCDTIRKAKNWLAASEIDYQFHDYRTDGLDQDRLQKWCDQLGWEILINRRGTTWRKLPETAKSELNEEKAIDLMLANPAMIKRPLLETGKDTIIGFNPSEYERLLG